MAARSQAVIRDQRLRSATRDGRPHREPERVLSRPQPMCDLAHLFDRHRPAKLMTADEKREERRRDRFAICKRAFQRCYPKPHTGQPGPPPPPRWARLSDPAFHYKCKNDAIRQFVRTWQPADGSALLTGWSGAGKTVGAHALLARLWHEIVVDDDCSPGEASARANLRIIDAADIIKVALQQGAGKGPIKLYAELVSAAVLIITEVGPQAPDRPGYYDLFGIVDKRASSPYRYERRTSNGHELIEQPRSTIVMSGFPADERERELDPRAPTCGGDLLIQVYGFQFIRRLVDPGIGRRVPTWSSPVSAEDDQK